MSCIIDQALILHRIFFTIVVVSAHTAALAYVIEL